MNQPYTLLLQLEGPMQSWGYRSRFDYRDTAAPGEEASFYYLRVRQVDGEVAWASPIWVAAP